VVLIFAKKAVAFRKGLGYKDVEYFAGSGQTAAQKLDEILETFLVRFGHKSEFVSNQIRKAQEDLKEEEFI
jgi:hypothetical protein